MTQNIEQRTQVAVAQYENASGTIDKFAHADEVVNTPAGAVKTFPKISKEWDENSQKLTADWKAERDALSIKALPVLAWINGETETNINQQRRFTDGHTYLAKVVPALMNAEPDNNWIAYTADKSDVLSDVFGSKPVDLVNNMTITPTNNQYPKLAAFGAIYELADNSVSYTVKSFTQSVGGDCVITLSDDSLLIAKKVNTASKSFVADYTNNYDGFRTFSIENISNGSVLNDHDAVIYNSKRYPLSEPATGTVANLNLVSRPPQFECGGKTIYMLNERHYSKDRHNVKAWWAVGDYYLQDGSVNPNPTTDNSIFQLIINYSKTSFSTAKKIYAPSAGYLFEKPLLWYERDGVTILGDGRESTKFFTTGEMIPDFTVVPKWETNNYRGYTYADKRALFVVAARRVNGGIGGEPNPDGKNAAAWYLGFQGFSVIGEKGRERQVSIFYAPELAHSYIQDVFGQYVRYGLEVSDIYRTRIEDFDVHNSIAPINHFSTAEHTASGTSLTLLNCGCARITYGWKMDNLQYSSWNNITCDHWSLYRQSGATGAVYAYDFKNCYLSIKGIGAELGSEAGMVNPRLLRQTGNGFLGIESGGLFIDTPNSWDNDLVVIDNAPFTSKNVLYSLRTNGVNDGRILLSNSAQCCIEGFWGNQLLSQMIKKDHSSYLDIESANAKQLLILDKAEHQFAASASIFPVPHDQTFNVQLLSTSDGSAFNCGITGLYQFDWSARCTGTTFLHAALMVNGVEVFRQILDDTATDNQITISKAVSVDAGQQIEWKVKTNGGASCVLKNSSIKIDMIK